MARLSCAKEWPRTPTPFHAFSQRIIIFQMLQSKVAYIHPGEAGGGWGSPRVDSETDLLQYPDQKKQPNQNAALRQFSTEPSLRNPSPLFSGLPTSNFLRVKANLGKRSTFEICVVFQSTLYEPQHWYLRLESNTWINRK